jgi:hypothetical protein
MTRMRIDGALRRRLERGEYVVNERAVAEAMVASGVFVALETGQLLSFLAEQDESGAGRDAA